MKKIFTLLFVVGMFTMAQAQPGNRDNRQGDQRNDQRNDQRYDQQNDQRYDQRNDQRDFDKGYDKGRFIVETNRNFEKDGRYDDRFGMERKRDMMIARINQEYDYKIQKVKRNFFMDWYVKQRQIRNLENERQWQISMVYERFNDYRGRNRNNDRDDRYHDRDEHSRGRY